MMDLLGHECGLLGQLTNGLDAARGGGQTPAALQTSREIKILNTSGPAVANCGDKGDRGDTLKRT